MPGTGFAKRAIDLIIQLGHGDYGASGYDEVRITGLRVSVSISKVMMPGYSEAEIRIFGLSQSLMNRLSTLGKLSDKNARDNVVTVLAGDAASGMATVFRGTLQTAYADLQGAPDVSFNMMAYGGLLAALKPVPAISYKGAADVAVILAGLARSMTPPFTFENSGVSGVILSDPYFPGSAREQIRRCVEAAGVQALIDEDNHVLAVWPKGGSRGGAIPTISASTGMVGYPAYWESGVAITTLHNPSIRVGGPILVQSEITPACGKWVVLEMSHTLESETVGGAWFTQIKAYLFGTSAPIPAAA